MFDLASDLASDLALDLAGIAAQIEIFVPRPEASLRVGSGFDEIADWHCVIELSAAQKAEADAGGGQHRLARAFFDNRDRGLVSTETLASALFLAGVGLWAVGHFDIGDGIAAEEKAVIIEHGAIIGGRGFAATEFTFKPESIPSGLGAAVSG